MSFVERNQRWFALGMVCVSSLMIVLDATIVNVALPSIQQDLGFSQADLAWLVNAYLLTFGGCMLLAGRAADRAVAGPGGAAPWAPPPRWRRRRCWPCTPWSMPARPAGPRSPRWAALRFRRLPSSAS